ncbi:MAG: hypothetical protein PHY45_11845 [Rhodocyclaceae bacterium]|nr:hypothetical protein [Rhodocyclaceae bacterium]
MTTSYIPEEGSKEERAIAFVFKHGSARTPTLSCAVGIAPSDVDELMAPAVEHGLLTACDVTTPSGPAKEYRAAGTVKTSSFNPTIFPKAPAAPAAQLPDMPAYKPETKGRAERAVQLEKELQVTTAIPARRGAETSKAKPAAKATRSPRGDRQKQVVDVLANRQAPTTVAELHALMPDATHHALARAVRKAEGKGALDSVGVGGRVRAYFVPGAGQVEAKAKPAAEGQKTVAKVQKNAVPAPAKLQPETAIPPFRCGIYSDGALRLDGDMIIDEAGGVILSKAQAGIVVDYLRRVDMLELGA